MGALACGASTPLTGPLGGACAGALDAVSIALNVGATVSDLALLLLGHGSAGDLILDTLEMVTFGMSNAITRGLPEEVRLASEILNNARSLPFSIPGLDKLKKLLSGDSSATAALVQVGC
jgi:hypothetical protein